MFDVLDTIYLSPNDVRKMTRNVTAHVSERGNRFSIIDFQNLKVIKAFIVDTGHENGFEIHALTSNAEILIFNFQTRKLITALFPRVLQVYRYYDILNEEPPLFILDKAEENFTKGLNQI